MTDATEFPDDPGGFKAAGLRSYIEKPDGTAELAPDAASNLKKYYKAFPDRLQDDYKIHKAWVESARKTASERAGAS